MIEAIYGTVGDFINMNPSLSFTIIFVTLLFGAICTRSQPDYRY